MSKSVEMGGVKYSIIAQSAEIVRLKTDSLLLFIYPEKREVAITGEIDDLTPELIESIKEIFAHLEKYSYL